MLILGCGNADRSDDAAGLLVVQRLRQLGCDAREHSGDILDLLQTWNHEAEVIVIDTVVSGAAPGTIVCCDATAAPLRVDGFGLSTHVLGLAEAVELARALGRLPAKLTIYGIEGARFTFGEPPLPEVAEAVEQLAQEIVRRKV